MNTRQITKVLEKDPVTKLYFQGVFPSDQLPSSILRYPAVLVANVDPHEKPGSHWCAFYFTQDQKGEFFDSYGLKPEDYVCTFNDFVKRNSKEWTFNHQRLQSLDSNVCGHYCLYYLTNRCRNVSLKTIVARFSRNFNQNDRFVYRFITKHYGHFYHYLKKYVTQQTSKSRKK